MYFFLIFNIRNVNDNLYSKACAKWCLTAVKSGCCMTFWHVLVS